MAKPRKAGTPPVAQPAATPERGEHNLTLNDTTYRLRPSHAAIRAIETKTGKSMLALVRAGNTGDLLIEQLAIIATELISAGATDELTRHVGVEGIGDLIFEEGLPGVTSRLTLCLLDAVTGGRTTSGEVKAATA